MSVWASSDVLNESPISTLFKTLYAGILEAPENHQLDLDAVKLKREIDRLSIKQDTIELGRFKDVRGIDRVKEFMGIYRIELSTKRLLGCTVIEGRIATPNVTVKNKKVQKLEAAA